MELVRVMLQGHGIEAEIAPIATVHRYSLPTLWVRDADVDRAALLVDQMAEAMKNPPTGWWRCRSCGEHSEALYPLSVST